MRTTHRRRFAALLVAAAALAGCATLPTSGPVIEGSAEVPPSRPVGLSPIPPRGGETPEEIVRGFLDNQAAGPTSTAEFTAAREYLVPTVQDEWDPLSQVVVVDADPVLTLDADELEQGRATVSGTASVVATVDGRGQYVEASPGTQTAVSFGLAQGADGEWRIDATPGGLLLSVPNFDNAFRSTRLYFPSPDRAFWVPDERWFPGRNWQTYAVREVLAGPPEWLQGAVTSVVPDGTALSIQSVTIDDDGVAAVDLTSQIAEASREDRALLEAQLEETLVEAIAVERVRAVQLLDDGSPLTTADDVPIPRKATGSGPAVVVADGTVMRVENRSLAEVAEVSPLDGLDPTALAVGTELDPVVVLDGSDRLVQVGTPTTDAQTLMTGTDLVAPSIDRFGGVWSGPSGAGLLVALPGGAVVEIEAPWLEDRTVVGLRVAHDGARVAVISSGSSGLALQVSGVVRGEADVPVRLTEPVGVGAQIAEATDLVWIEENLLGVLGRTAADSVPTVQAVPVGGQSRTLSAVDGALELAAGQGESSLLLGTAGGELYGRPPSSVLWTRLALDTDEVSLPAYPG
ncbi:LpqB family beta-propeller domain-containing protein [Oerskovia flava]|uniref:LpqB family beta-propeller domain-containing protein n=1 Tax=Oerskovia flava TaxID=2986422 RepID=UPI00223FB1A5|nr:LpqB family beta-propeller domain-containing protein [Oerskovia sp. JB1-3-2]